MKQEQMGSVIAVVGLGDGDEGKGKVTDYQAQRSNYVVRCQGGSNAGHTSRYRGEEIALHQIPSGICNEEVVNVMGTGVFLDPAKLDNEREDLENKVGLTVHAGNFAISHQAHLVLPVHVELDKAREKNAKDKQGTTKAGIAYVASDKALREGVRAEDIQGASGRDLIEMALERRDILAKRYGLSRGRTALRAARVEAEIFAVTSLELEPYIQDTTLMLHDRLSKGAHILLEGAQAFGLDLDQGKFPFVTSSNPTTAGLLQGSGINHQVITDVFGVTKLVPSKVGVFITKMDDELASKVRGKRGEIDSEFGKSTGRPRDLGYLDLPKLARAILANGVTQLALTKSDWIQRMGKTTKIAVAYEVTDAYGKVTIEKVAPGGNKALLRSVPIYEEFATWTDIKSKQAKRYFKFIEEMLERPVTIIGTGPGRDDLIFPHGRV